MSPRKPKEFLFKHKGRFNEGNKRVYKSSEYRNRQRGIIYLSHTHLRFEFKNGGELVIAVNEIKNLANNSISFKDSLLLSRSPRLTIEITTDLDEKHQFWAGRDTKRLYKQLVKVAPNLSDWRIKGTESSSGVGGDISFLLYAFLRLFCLIFLISGGILFFVDVGLPGLVLDWDGPAIYINPLSITLLVIGVILLVVLMGRECFEDCDDC